jgi:hypothetical protein
MSIFISGFRDTRSFLAWLRASYHGDLMAQLKVKNLIVVPSNTEEFRAAVSALLSLNGKTVWVSTSSRSQRTAVRDFW